MLQLKPEDSMDIKNGQEKRMSFKPLEAAQCCSGGSVLMTGERERDFSADWILNVRETKAGKIPFISTRLSLRDILGGWRVRWGIKRMAYRVDPGLYGVGNPDESSPVLVTANYKLTFDKVRKELAGVGCWILVLDTKGVNVWCAAGKGTFGTAELARRLASSRVSALVNHKKIILPQLGATGVSAHEIRRTTGFKVIYGPVRAKEIQEFLSNGYQKTEQMRTVYFPLAERLAVAPIELVQSLKYLAGIFIVIAGVSVAESRGLNIKAVTDFLPFLGAALVGAFFFPALLPVLPFRSFAVKGYILGLLFTTAAVILVSPGLLLTVFYYLVLPPIISYISLNFTGASTYTSLAGTKLEVSVSLPLYAVSVAAGLIVRTFVLVKTLTA